MLPSDSLRYRDINEKKEVVTIRKDTQSFYFRGGGAGSVSPRLLTVHSQECEDLSD